MSPLDVEWLGEVSYAEALALQQEAVAARRDGSAGDRLLLLEHPPVVTLGRGARPEHLLVPEAELRRRGIELHEAGRGGDVTYHAPGQLVGYLIVDLRARREPDVGRFLRRVEAALIDALRSLGIAGRRWPGRTGVFVGPRHKIASVGIGLRHWVTWHGFALNVSLDLRGFDVVVPCGLADVDMTSVQEQLGCAPSDLDARVRARVAACFQNAFVDSRSGRSDPARAATA